MRTINPFYVIIIAGFVTAQAHADPFHYDEAISGPLSNDLARPTSLAADIGLNMLIGEIDHSTTGDFFTFTVPLDASMPSIVVEVLSNPADFSFTLSRDVIDWQDQSAFLYSGETDDEMIGLNLLSELRIGELPAGSYWFFLGTDDGSLHDYQMSFSIHHPEPASALLLASGLWCCRRRRCISAAKRLA